MNRRPSRSTLLPIPTVFRSHGERFSTHQRRDREVGREKCGTRISVIGLGRIADDGSGQRHGGDVSRPAGGGGAGMSCRQPPSPLKQNAPSPPPSTPPCLFPH